jgi:hypothetical protein
MSLHGQTITHALSSQLEPVKQTAQGCLIMFIHQ